MRDDLAGALVTETFEYDGGRDVTAYVPQSPPEAIVFAGDGQLIAPWGALLEAADVPSTMVVGAVFGVSAGGELALAMGARHPDVYGAVFCASPGAGFRPAEVSPISRAYLVAGTQEPFFLENAARWATALRDAGADVVMTERVGSHGDPFWREEFPLMVAWAFGHTGLR